jgi:hypothetical protein
VRTQALLQLVKTAANLAALHDAYQSGDTAVQARSQHHTCSGHALPRDGKEQRADYVQALPDIDTAVRSMAETLADLVGRVAQNHHGGVVVAPRPAAKALALANSQLSADC